MANNNISTKNGKTTAKSIKDLGAALQAGKPNLKSLENGLIEAFSSEFAVMDQIKARKAEIVKLFEEQKALEVKGATWFRTELEIGKREVVERKFANELIENSPQLQELRVHLESRGKIAEWKNTVREFVDDHVIKSIGQEKWDEYQHIRANKKALIEQVEALKAAIATEEQAIKDLLKK